MRTNRFLVAVVVIACGACSPAGVSEAQEEAAREEVAKQDKVVSLFDGETLGKWKSIHFNGEGDVHVSFEGALTLEQGAPMTGIVWTGDAKKLPRTNYEITLEGMKDYGNDFFCALTFPVKEDYATFICGGWGGTVVGISSIDGEDAALNETTKSFEFEDDKYYKVRVRVTDERITGWIDEKKMFEVVLEGKSIGLRPGQIELCKPLGIASFDTRSAFRKIEMRRLAISD